MPRNSNVDCVREDIGHFMPPGIVHVEAEASAASPRDWTFLG
jgi:hypothetical protein